MGGFVMSLELIDRKVGSSFPRHQQHQQLGSEGAQGLAVDQLDLFARLHVSNLGEQEAQGFPARERHTGSATVLWARETNRGKTSTPFSYTEVNARVCFQLL